MTGLDVADLVAAKINGAGLVLDPNAEVRLAPIVKSEDLPDSSNVVTHVMFGGRSTERAAKGKRWRVFTIVIACYRRVGEDKTLANELFTLVDQIDDTLVREPLAGVERRDIFQDNNAPYVPEHMRDNGIALGILEATYTLTIDDRA